MTDSKVYTTKQCRLQYSIQFGATFASTNSVFMYIILNAFFRNLEFVIAQNINYIHIGRIQHLRLISCTSTRYRIFTIKVPTSNNGLPLKNPEFVEEKNFYSNKILSPTLLH